MVEVLVFDNAEELALAAAGIFRDRLEHNCALSVAVSGGSTPGPSYQKIAELNIDWNEISIWWVDERFVDPSDDASNEKLVRTHWLNRVSVPFDQVHPMYRDASPQTAAETYESEWIYAFGEGGVDLAFMGIGADGHTASLFPGDTASLESDRLVIPTTSPAGVAQRVTLTKKALSRCGELVFIATGKEKAPYVKSMTQGTGEWPSCVVSRAAKKVTILVDREAYGA